jgi:MBOAT, membrane-bound O-acyltransferase family
MNFAAAVLIAYAAILLFFPAQRLRRLARTLTWLAATAVVALSPALVPLDCSVERLGASLVAIGLMAKLYDLFRTSNERGGRGFRWYAAWLVNFFWLVQRRVPPAWPRSRDWRRLLRLLLEFGCGMALAVLVFRIDWAAYPLALEHVVKVTVIYWVVVSWNSAVAVVFRLSGAAALDPFASPIAAATLTEFWRRWNRPARQFLEEYAFRPAGGLRQPRRATLVTFVVSAIVHEFLFDIAAGQIQGWQAAFFLVQGAATALTFHVRPRGAWRALGVFLTLLFNYATAWLFFQSVNALLPFYSPRAV